MRRTIDLDNQEIVRALVGVGDQNLKRVRDALHVDIVVRNERLLMQGSERAVDRSTQAFNEMLRIIRNGDYLERTDVERIVNNAGRDPKHNPVRGRAVSKFNPAQTDGRPQATRESGDSPLAGRVKALTKGQALYISAMQKFDVVFSIGPAGSGKTYLAVAMAVEALSKNLINRLVLVRPAVEAGESLGFLPGDLSEKVNPYLRPLYDGLHDLMSPQQTARMIENGIIEVAPLAFMRGRTLNNAFVILDEAQNTTPKQMKMFLTRLGRDARAVITGDVTQVDLPDSKESGLDHARKTLRGVEGISFIHLEKQDIVRHPLVQRIVDAYDTLENQQKNESRH